MLVLYETSAGLALFKVLDEGKLAKPVELAEAFENAETAAKVVKLKEFVHFGSTAEALEACTAVVEGDLGKQMKKLIKKAIVKKGLTDETLVVGDQKLAQTINKKMGLSCVYDSSTLHLMRGLRTQATNLIGEVEEKEMHAMALGLSHSLSRFKLKFNTEKIDTMIVQAISLLDDLDKELNTYAMRAREWYGWHFPEMEKIVSENLLFCRTVLAIGPRDNAKNVDLDDILPEDAGAAVRAAAVTSMGPDVNDSDMVSIKHLCEQVVKLSEYRASLYEYLKNRMQAVAPNLTLLVGELVGARLIAHAGSLMNLAKFPASTVQILGAEKALFRALKTKHETPKYGLLYHASLVGQAHPKNKGKVARVLSSKCALASRVDALAEEVPSVGEGYRQKVEQRMEQLEARQARAGAEGGNKRRRF